MCSKHQLLKQTVEMNSSVYFCLANNDTFILSARNPKATIMSPGLLILFSTLTVWENRVGEYDLPSFGTVAQKFSSSLSKAQKKPPTQQQLT